VRIADKMNYTQVTSSLQKNRGEMSQMQTQAATQKRVTKPSDDPVASAKVLAARSDERGHSQFVKNINVAKSFLEFTDQSLNEVSEVLMRLKELAIGQASDAGVSADTRRLVSAEVGQAFSQIVQIGNRKLGERYIFGGFQTTQRPFDTEGNYKGDDGEIRIHTNKDSFVSMNLSGDRVFLGKAVGPDGTIKGDRPNPTTPEDLQQYQNQDLQKQEQEKELEQGEVRLRAPASLGRSETTFNTEVDERTGGLNILKAVKDFEIGLRVNDKNLIQESIDHLDLAITQVVHARAQVGAKLQSVTQTQESLQKAIVDNKVTVSQAEDVDVFQLVSDMAKADSTLKATMDTSGRILSPSLLDFLK
jgi:flagellar hook-associated protein 3 FlgL